MRKYQASDFVDMAETAHNAVKYGEALSIAIAGLGLEKSKAAALDLLCRDVMICTSVLRDDLLDLVESVRGTK